MDRALSAVCGMPVRLRPLGLHERHGFNLTIVRGGRLAALAVALPVLRAAVVVGAAVPLAVPAPVAGLVLAAMGMAVARSLWRRSLVAAAVGRRDLHLDELLDVAEIRHLLAVAEGNRD